MGRSRLRGVAEGGGLRAAIRSGRAAIRRGSRGAPTSRPRGPRPPPTCQCRTTVLAGPGRTGSVVKRASPRAPPSRGEPSPAEFSSSARARERESRASKQSALSERAPPSGGMPRRQAWRRHRRGVTVAPPLSLRRVQVGPAGPRRAADPRLAARRWHSGGPRPGRPGGPAKPVLGSGPQPGPTTRTGSPLLTTPARAARAALPSGGPGPGSPAATRSAGGRAVGGRRAAGGRWRAAGSGGAAPVAEQGRSFACGGAGGGRRAAHSFFLGKFLSHASFRARL